MKTATSPLHFVGREAELAHLREQMVLAHRERQPRYLLIDGEVGTGKSELVKKFLEETARGLPESQLILTALGSCSMENKDSTYTPFNQIAEQLGSKIAHWSLDTKTLVNLAKEVAPDWVNVVTLGLPVLTTLIKVLKAGSARSRSKKIGDENKFAEYVNLLREFSTIRPMTIAVDDLHFSDETSLLLLFHMMRNLDACPILVICTARPLHQVGDMPYKDLNVELQRHWHDVISLDRTEGINVANYLIERYGNVVLPEELVEAVQGQSGGNPLFITELFSLWETKGNIIQQRENTGRPLWALNETLPLNLSDVPDKMGIVIERRIEQLNEQLRALLTDAAVEGEEFIAQVVGSLLKLDEDELFKEIQVLEKHRLIFRKEKNPRDELSFYLFAHRFIQSYIYDKLLNVDRRRILHARTGELLERLYQDRRGQIAAQLARHFAEGHLYSKALEYCIVAAEADQSDYNWYQAIRWCEQGLDMLDKLREDEKDAWKSTRLKLLELKAFGSSTSGNYKRAVTIYSQLIAEREGPELKPEQVVDWYLGLSDALDEQDEYEESHQALEQARQYLTETPAQSDLPNAEIDIQDTLYLGRANRNQEALDLVTSAIAKLEKLPPSNDRTAALSNGKNHLGIILGYLARYEESIPMYREAADLGKSIGDTVSAIYPLLNMADDLMLTYRLDEAMDVLAEVTTHAKHRGMKALEAQAMCDTGIVLLRLGKIDESIKELSGAGAQLIKLGEHDYAVHALAHLSLALLSKGDVTIALHYARQAVDLCEGFAYTRGIALDSLAQVEATAGDQETALRHFEEAIHILEDAGNRHLVAVSERHLAEAFHSFGNRETATALAKSALRKFNELGLKHEIETTKKLYFLLARE